MTNICLWMVYMQILGTSLVSKGKIKEIMHCGRFCPAEQYLNAIENESYTSLVLVSWIQFATSAGGLDDARRLKTVLQCHKANGNSFCNFK